MGVEPPTGRNVVRDLRQYTKRALLRVPFSNDLYLLDGVTDVTYGGAYRVRTDDLIHAMDARYQLRQCPISYLVLPKPTLWSAPRQDRRGCANAPRLTRLLFYLKPVFLATKIL